MGSSGAVFPLGGIRDGASGGDRRRCVGGAGEVRGYRTLGCRGGGRIPCRPLLRLGWKVVHVEEAGKPCLEIGGRFLGWLLFFVAEHAGFGKRIAVVDSSVTASKAESGKVGDEVAGVDFRVGEIPNFGEVVFAWISCVCQEKNVQCW